MTKPWFTRREFEFVFQLCIILTFKSQYLKQRSKKPYTTLIQSNFDIIGYAIIIFYLNMETLITPITGKTICRVFKFLHVTCSVF